jgi:hypothetical protein
MSGFVGHGRDEVTPADELIAVEAHLGAHPPHVVRR